MTSLPMQGVDLVRAVRDTKRIVQVGMQQRSMAHFIEAKQRFFDTGLIGTGRTWSAPSGTPTAATSNAGPAGMETKPAGLDWDACLGWLPKIPWDPKRYFNRFAYWDFSTGGQTGGLFVHMVDVVHWYLGLTRARAAVALGGIYQYNDGRDTPDNINAIVDYPQNLTVTFEATVTDMIPRDSAIIVFMGSGGRLSIFRHGYTFQHADTKRPDITAGPTPESAHMANFLDCVRTRKQPNADAVSGHYSALACHIMNMAYKQGGRVVWDNNWDV